MTLNFMVCPHDTATNPDRWYRFVQYIGQKIGIQIQFDISLDFTDFRDNLAKADIAYANPSDTMKLVGDGLVSIVRPANLHDEVTFICSKDIASPSLDMLAGQNVASVASLQPTKLAMHVLKERGIAPAGIDNHESWTSVVSAIWREEAKYGLIYADTYNGLSDQGKEMVNAYFTSDEKVNFHTLVVGRNAMDKKDELAQMLLAMDSDAQGKEVLEALNVTQWVAVTQEDIDKIKHIMEAY